MSLTINDVKLVFDKHLPKEELSKLSYDDTNCLSVINSSTKWYNFDCSETGTGRLCTIDSVEALNNDLIFAEFKNEKIKSGDKLKLLRLKATESILSLHKLLKKEHTNIELSDINLISKKCYFVFSKAKTRPTELLLFNTTHRDLKSFYKNSLYKDFDFIDCESFIRKFGL